MEPQQIQQRERPSPVTSGSAPSVSRESHDSRDNWVNFKGPSPVNSRSAPSVSRESHDSRDNWVNFKGPSPVNSGSAPSVSRESHDSRDNWVNFKGQASDAIHSRKEYKQNPQFPKTVKGHGGPQINTGVDFIFTRLEENIGRFMRDELKKFCAVLSSECESPMTEGDVEYQRNCEAFLKITHYFLRQMGHKELALRLYNQVHYPEVCRSKLKSGLERRCQSVHEGIAKAGISSPLKNIYTKLHITEDGATEGEANVETALSPHTSVTLHHILTLSTQQRKPIRTVLIKGVAGVGKSLLTQKFCLDWAEGRAHQDIQLLLPISFRELNVLRDTQFSLVSLVHYFFSETKKTRLHSFKNLQVLFILDGLDECRIPLDFRKTKALSDAAEVVSVDVLLVNLLRGDLLPSARIWITTRPAAASQIPPECIFKVIEVKGFTNLHKDKYFTLKFKHMSQASAIIAHIKSSRSLYMMCRLPVFSWIISTVLLHVLRTATTEQLPQTLTEMYIHFLVVQTKLRSLKYDGRLETDAPWSEETKKTVHFLGKLAFEQLQKGNQIFYDSDLNECGLDAATASLYSGVFTQVFREESGLYQNTVYCFVHHSVQEFLAALHVHQTFINSGVNLLSEERTMSIRSMFFGYSSSETFYQTVVDKMLQGPSGDLDLFTRFLLGLSLPSNQDLLRGLVKHTRVGSPQKMTEYITQKLQDGQTVKRSMSLFHCLNELKERSLVEQMQQRLSSGRPIRETLSTAQWSALVFILLSSDRLDVFELKKYCVSEEALLKLLPVVKASSSALLSSCDLTEKSCEAICLMFSSPACALKELDLSFNQLQDPGLKLLALALRSPHCRLQQLRVAGCQLTEVGCLSLASALSSKKTQLTLLDLSYNHPGPLGVQQLTALQGAPGSRLDTLILRPAGPQWLSPVSIYFTQLHLDSSTAYQCLQLSQNNTRASHVQQDQAYPEHAGRFDKCPQVLCSEGLSGRAYWEVEWSGTVVVAVSYRSLTRKGNSVTCGFGLGPDSWCLSCSKGRYLVTHNSKRLVLNFSSSSSGRAGVYVDFLAGSVSFYAVSSEELVHLHTYRDTFTQPLVAGFQLLFGSTVRLCDLLEEKPSYM